MAKHIITVNKASLQETVHTGGCGECQTSCQSACKTSCTVGNQVCQKQTARTAPCRSFSARGLIFFKSNILFKGEK